MRSLSRNRLGSAGFSQVELLMAILIMAIAVIPLLDSFAVSSNPDGSSAGYADLKAMLLNHTRARMEEILTQDFDDISLSPSPTDPVAGLSDMVMVRGQPVARLVYAELYDEDNDGNTPPDPRLKKITVRMQDVQLETVKCLL